MIEIIADIGINHFGRTDIIRQLIANIAECGANTAKFQWYSAYDLFGNPRISTFNKDIYEKIVPFDLSEKQIEQIMRWCEIEGIEFMCSVFDNKRFDALEGLGVKKHKIASRVSKFDRPLAEKMLATGKPCYASLGFGAEPFDTVKYPNCRHLFCVASYPTEYSELTIPAKFDEYFGFSSHSMNSAPSMIAISRGAQVIEVHFTLSKGMSAVSGGLDHISSLEKTDLRELIVFARKAEKILPYCK